jgi:hypothetical protein
LAGRLEQPAKPIAQAINAHAAHRVFLSPPQQFSCINII